MTDWASARLTPQHDLTAFDSGQPSLDAWLREHAHRAQQQGTARSWVWTKTGEPKVEAYFSIAPTTVARDVLTSSQSGGTATVPGYLLARLALDRSLQDQQLGGQLLRDALERIIAASEGAGGRLIVVDAIDQRAERFYSRFDFRPTRQLSVDVRDEEMERVTAGNIYPRRMVVKISTVCSALGS